jgi:hypothetical protein
MNDAMQERCIQPQWKYCSITGAATVTAVFEAVVFVEEPSRLLVAS